MSSGNNSKALAFIQQNLSFFIEPIKNQRYFRLWAKEAKQTERLRPLSDNLHTAIGLGPNNHMREYVQALLGHLVDETDVSCLLYGDDRWMWYLLNENTQLAQAILAFKNSSVLTQWNIYHPEHVTRTNKINKLQCFIKPLSLAITEAQLKGYRLKQRGFTQKSEAIYWLTDNIVSLLREFVESPDEKHYLQLKIKGLEYIKTVKPKLKAHRGWKQIFGNIALAIAGLGVIYGAAITVNKLSSGNFLFFNTDSVNKIDELQHCIEDLELPKTP